MNKNLMTIFLSLHSNLGKFQEFKKILKLLYTLNLRTLGLVLFALLYADLRTDKTITLGVINLYT